MRILLIAPLVAGLGCSSTPTKTRPPVVRSTAPPLPSALRETPDPGALPVLVDSSLQVNLGRPRQNGRIRVELEFKINGYLEADDMVVVELLRGRSPVGGRVECPQRRSSRTGVTVECSARSEQTTGEIPQKAGKYNFKIHLKRDGSHHLLRRGRFEVFKCSYGLCLNRDGILGEHWAHFENRKEPRLVFRLAVKNRPAMPALHPDPKRQAKAKKGLEVRTLTTTCFAGKKKLGRTSESFKVLDELDGVWTRLLARSDLFLLDLQDLGKGPMRCKIKLNAKLLADLRFQLGEDGMLVMHKAQRGKKGLESPWWWLDARRPGRQDSRARASVRNIRNLRLSGRR